MKQILFLLIFILMTSSGSAQVEDTIALGFKEYLAMVKRYHPLVKQADLILDEGEVKLLKARGNFDPKIEADYSAKNYKDTEYYNKFNSAFKIPTWYGVELNAKFENNSGEYLNPQNNVPEDGLYSAGISLNVGDGILMSERMAALKQAKIYRDQTQLKRQLQVTEVLYKASLAYFEWYTAYQQYNLFESFLDNAEIRYQGVASEYEVGEKPAIDTVEAGLSIQSRKLDLQQSKLDLINAGLNLSNFLWMDGNIPLEMTPEVVPGENLQEELTETFNIDELLFGINLEEHPKLRSLNYEVDMMEVEKRLRANKLLPKLDLEYNFLTSNAEDLNTLNNRNYKMGVKFSFPIFLRKERGELQLAKLELENAELDLVNARLKLENELRSLQNQIVALNEQNDLMDQLVNDYTLMVVAEERKFELGESSLFLINSRENKLISARLKEIEMNLKLLKSKAELFKTLAEVVEL